MLRKVVSVADGGTPSLLMVMAIWMVKRGWVIMWGSISDDGDGRDGGRREVVHRVTRGAKCVMVCIVWRHMESLQLTNLRQSTFDRSKQKLTGGECRVDVVVVALR